MTVSPADWHPSLLVTVPSYVRFRYLIFRIENDKLIPPAGRDVA